MSGQPFHILFGGGEPLEEALSLCQYVDAFYARLGASRAEIDIGKVNGVVGHMRVHFPWHGGWEKASPFKKVAAFATDFVTSRPILTPFPAAFAYADLASHQNEIIALSLAIDALDGATIECPMRGTIVLERRVALSEHFWKELVVALSRITFDHFALLAMLFEALCYQVNPSASYERII